MECPACTNELAKKSVANIELDVCDNGCGGIWFDQFEFKKFDEKSEPDAESILHLTVKAKAPPQERLACPKCKPQMMMRHFSSVKRHVAIDECPKCAGVWLDAGELTAIRAEFDTEEQRYAAAENLFDDLFGAKLEEEKRKSREHLARVQRYAIFSNFLGRRS
jgi:Zn-finger nucleic acid-binding protein